MNLFPFFACFLKGFFSQMFEDMFDFNLLWPISFTPGHFGHILAGFVVHLLFAFVYIYIAEKEYIYIFTNI